MAESRSSSLTALERRGWRIVFASSAGLYLVGSHWPRLEMDPVGEAGPSPDKILHFLAFLLLTLPAWWTGWFRTLIGLWLAGVGFAVFDEVTQWLLPIERNITAGDLLCDACGITAGVAILAASRPMDDPRSRRLAAQRGIAEATLLSKTSNWLVLGVTGMLGAVVLVPLAVLLADPLRIEARAMAVAGGALGIAVAGLVGLEFGTRATVRRLRRANACVRCGSADAAANCDNCGAEGVSQAWFEPPRPTAAAVLDAAWWPLLRAGVVATATIVLLGVFGLVERWWPDETTIARVVDFTVLVVAAAWGIHGARRRLARLASEADRRCVRCGHDLRGLKDAHGIANCPECGSPFLFGTDRIEGAVRSTQASDGETMSG